MNLHQKLVEIRKNIKGFSKDTKGYDYIFVSGTQILRAIKDKKDELGQILVPEIDYSTFHWEKHEYVTVKGKEKLDFIVTAKMTYTWINAEEPTDKLVVPWVCIGQQTDDISKAMGTALTYNERYFLLKFLGIPTDEDDADSKPPTEAQRSYSNNYNSKKLSDKQLARLYALANKAGVDKDLVKQQVMKKFNKEVKDLTKPEYDLVCNGYEKAAEKTA